MEYGKGFCLADGPVHRAIQLTDSLDKSQLVVLWRDDESPSQVVGYSEVGDVRRSACVVPRHAGEPVETQLPEEVSRLDLISIRTE